MLKMYIFLLYLDEIYKPALLSITHSIIDRLNQINDGSFYVEDQATESLSV